MVESTPPAARSTIMVLVLIFGRAIKREQDLLNTLAFSALLMLFINPRDLYDIGFQLSFLTMGSIIYIPPKLEEFFKPRTKKKNFFVSAFLVSFSAWLGSAPFVASYFNIVTPVALIANIFIVPWMFFVLASSVAFIIFGFMSAFLGLVFSQASGLAILILVKMAHLFSLLPFAYFRAKSPPWPVIALFYLSLFLFFKRKRLGIRGAYFLIAGIVLSNTFIWGALLMPARKDLNVTFLNVGKGDACFVEFPGGGSMLIDGGEGAGADMGRLVVGRFLSSKGVNTIDAVVATHPHTDHIGGLASVLKNFTVRYFIDNGDSEPNSFYRECRDLIRQKRIKRFTLKEGDRIKGFGSVSLLALNPAAEKSFTAS